MHLQEKHVVKSSERRD